MRSYVETLYNQPLRGELDQLVKTEGKENATQLEKHFFGFFKVI